MERIVLANPYNEYHIKLFEDLEKSNAIIPKISSQLRHISQKGKEEEYKERVKRINEIDLLLFKEEDGTIKDYCTITGEKDRKVANIMPSSITSMKKNSIIIQAIDYAFNTLNVNEVFIMTSPNNKNMIQFLTSNGLENLGEEEDFMVFLAEKDNNNKTQRMIA